MKRKTLPEKPMRYCVLDFARRKSLHLVIDENYYVAYKNDLLLEYSKDTGGDNT